MDANEQAAVQQEIGTLQADIDHLKQEVITAEKIYRAELEAHQTTKQILEDIREKASIPLLGEIS